MIKSIAKACIRLANSAVLNPLGRHLVMSGFVPRLNYFPRFDAASKRMLAPSLAVREVWPYSDRDSQVAMALSGDFAAIWTESREASIKWLNYFDIYEKIFSHLRGKKIRVLEIGVYEGASLKTWRIYFGANATIVGIDIDRKCARYDAPENGINVRIGSQSNPAFLSSVVDEFGPFDLILDDGSHNASDQIASFNALFGGGLKSDGIYLIEDLETAYLGHVSGHLDARRSIVDFARMIVDEIHDPYFRYGLNAFKENQLDAESSIEAPRIARLVQEVRFFDSIVVFQKQDRFPPMLL